MEGRREIIRLGQAGGAPGDEERTTGKGAGTPLSAGSSASDPRAPQTPPPETAPLCGNWKIKQPSRNPAWMPFRFLLNREPPKREQLSGVRTTRHQGRRGGLRGGSGLSHLEDATITREGGAGLGAEPEGWGQRAADRPDSPRDKRAAWGLLPRPCRGTGRLRAQGPGGTNMGEAGARQPPCTIQAPILPVLSSHTASGPGPRLPLGAAPPAVRLLCPSPGLPVLAPPGHPSSAPCGSGSGLDTALTTRPLPCSSGPSVGAEALRAGGQAAAPRPAVHPCVPGLGQRRGSHHTGLGPARAARWTPGAQ